MNRKKHWDLLKQVISNYRQLGEVTLIEVVVASRFTPIPEEQLSEKQRTDLAETYSRIGESICARAALARAMPRLVVSLIVNAPFSDEGVVVTEEVA